MAFDPWAYDGPLRRADGQRAYNHYFWPMAGDSWWVHDDANPLPLQRMGWPNHFNVVALADGRWATDGTTYCIEENRDPYGRPCVFGTREAAVRVAAARFIRQARRARHWGVMQGITHEQCQMAMTWALAVVGRPSITLPLPVPVPVPKVVKTGMPLFDLEPAHA